MGTGFAELARACGDTAAEVSIVDRLLASPEAAASHADLMHTRSRKLLVGETADLLYRLVPHERLIWELIAVGALVDFPTFSSDRRLCRIGSKVLVRGILRDEHPDMSNVAFPAGNGSASVWVDGAAIVGVEKEDGIGGR